MKLPVLMILSALASIGGAWKINSDGRIFEFNWPQDSQDMSSIISKEDVNFYRPYFKNFAKSIGDQFSKMKKLKFDEGMVQQIYVNPKIEELYMHTTKTQTIDIDRSEEYAIISLKVVSCKLKKIPFNINHLTRLQKLNLRENRIEHINMNDFNGLNNLEELNLNENEMKTLATESAVQLPKLRVLSLAFNDLREVDVCLWEIPNLEDLFLSDNKLKFVVDLVDQFPKLKKLNIGHNPLVCAWKDALVRSADRIAQVERYLMCNAADKTQVPRECPMDSDVVKLKLNNENQSLQQTVTALIDQLPQIVKKSYDEHQATLKQAVGTLTGHVIKLFPIDWMIIKRIIRKFSFAAAFSYI